MGSSKHTHTETHTYNHIHTPTHAHNHTLKHTHTYSNNHTTRNTLTHTCTLLASGVILSKSPALFQFPPRRMGINFSLTILKVISCKTAISNCVKAINITSCSSIAHVSSTFHPPPALPLPPSASYTHSRELFTAQGVRVSPLAGSMLVQLMCRSLCGGVGLADPGPCPDVTRSTANAACFLLCLMCKRTHCAV